MFRTLYRSCGGGDALAGRLAVHNMGTRVVTGMLIIMLALMSIFSAPGSAMAQITDQTTPGGSTSDIDTGSNVTSGVDHVNYFQGKGISLNKLRDLTGLPHDASPARVNDFLNSNPNLVEKAKEKLANTENPEEAASAFKDAMNESKDDKKENAPTVDNSFYRAQSALTGFYGAEVGVAKSTEGNMDRAEAEGLRTWGEYMAQLGNAGAFMGYCDSTLMEGCTNWLGTGEAHNDKSYDYGGLAKKVGGFNDGVVQGNTGNATRDATKGLYEYATFGGALFGLGLDGMLTRTGRSSMETMMGYIMMFFYALSAGIDQIFFFTLKALDTLNVFRLFLPADANDMSFLFPKDYESTGSGAQTPAHSQAASDMMNNQVHASGGGVIAEAFKPVSDILNAIYISTVEIGWVAIMPLLIGFALISVFLFSRTDKMDTLKKLLIRMTYMAVGIPIVGMLYTAGLRSMMDFESKGNSSNASNLVLSTYMDFGSWVNNTRMYIPHHANVVIGWNTVTKSPSITSQLRVRDTALALNYESNPTFGGANTAETIIGLGRPSQGYAIYGRGFEMIAEGAEDMAATARFLATWNMLQSYVKGEQLSGAAFEQNIKAAIETKINDDADDELNRMFDNLQDVASVKSMKADDAKKNPLIYSPMPNDVNTPPGREYVTGDMAEDMKATDARATFEYMSRGKSCKANELFASKESKDPAACPMTPITMYNYLNTSFDSRKATYYSSTQSTSGMVRYQHAAVNLVGSGVTSLVYYGSAIVTLGSLVVIAVFYAGAILLANFKRTFQLIVAIPFAALGFISGIAKVIVYSLALLVEVLGTIFCFFLFQEFIIALPKAFEKMLIGIMSTSQLFGGGGNFMSNDIQNGVNNAIGNTAGGFLNMINELGVMGGNSNAIDNALPLAVPLSLIIIILMMIILLIFTIMALVFRKKFVAAIDEALTNIINKFLDTSVSSGNEPSPMKNALIGAGAMAGASYAMNGMGGNFDSDGDGRADMAGFAEGVNGAAASVGAGYANADNAIDAGGGAGGLAFDGSNNTDIDASTVGGHGSGIGSSHNMALAGAGIGAAAGAAAGIGSSAAADQAYAESIMSQGGLSDVGPDTPEQQAIDSGAVDNGDGTYTMPDGSVATFDSSGNLVAPQDVAAGEAGQGIADSAQDEARQAQGSFGDGADGLSDSTPGDTASAKDLPQIDHAQASTDFATGENAEGGAIDSSDDYTSAKTLGAPGVGEDSGSESGVAPSAASAQGDDGLDDLSSAGIDSSSDYAATGSAESGVAPSAVSGTSVDSADGSTSGVENTSGEKAAVAASAAGAMAADNADKNAETIKSAAQAHLGGVAGSGDTPYSATGGESSGNTVDSTASGAPQFADGKVADGAVAENAGSGYAGASSGYNAGVQAAGTAASSDSASASDSRDSIKPTGAGLSAAGMAAAGAAGAAVGSAGASSAVAGAAGTAAGSAAGAGAVAGSTAGAAGVAPSAVGDAAQVHTGNAGAQQGSQTPAPHSGEGTHISSTAGGGMAMAPGQTMPPAASATTPQPGVPQAHGVAPQAQGQGGAPQTHGMAPQTHGGAPAAAGSQAASHGPVQGQGTGQGIQNAQLGGGVGAAMPPAAAGAAGAMAAGQAGQANTQSAQAAPQTHGGSKNSWVGPALSGAAVGGAAGLAAGALAQQHLAQSAGNGEMVSRLASGEGQAPVNTGRVGSTPAASPYQAGPHPAPAGQPAQPAQGKPGEPGKAAPAASSGSQAASSGGGSGDDMATRMMKMQMMQRVMGAMQQPKKNQMSDLMNPAGKKGKPSQPSQQQQQSTGGAVLGGVLQAGMMSSMYGGGGQDKPANAHLEQQTDSVDRKPGEAEKKDK